MRQTSVQLYLLVVAMASLWQASAQDWGRLGNEIFCEGSNDFDRAGAAVALSADGGRLAVGASENDDRGSNSGHVRIFEYAAGNWVQLGADLDGSIANGWAGYAVSLSATGDRVAFGAPYADSGYVRIFDYIGTNWVQAGADIVGEATGDRSGISLSLSADGSRVAVGATLNDGSGYNAGHVRVHEWSGDSWTKVGSDIDGETALDNSGYAVALSPDGSRVAISAILNDDNGTNAGQVRVFEYNGASWIQLGTDIDGEAAGDASAESVSLSSDGSRLAIGNPYNDAAGNYAGQVRVMRFDGTNWVQLGNSIVGETEDDRSGNSVSLSADGNRVAIGAHFNDGAGNNAGSVRVFDYVEGQWIQNGSNIEGIGAEEDFGYRVALSADGRRVVAGSRTEGLGQVRVYTPMTAVPVHISDDCLNFLAVSNASYTLCSSESLTNGFNAVTNLYGDGLTNCIPIDFSSDQQFYKCLEALD